MTVLWCAAVALSTTVAWIAVNRVGTEVADVPVEGLAGVRTVAASGSTPSPTGSPTTAAAPGAQTAPTTAGPSTAPTVQPPTAPPASVPGPPTTSAPATTTSLAAATGLFELRGGTASVACSGDTATLQWAAPHSGYEVHVEEATPEVAVTFESEDHDSSLEAHCAAGNPVGSTTEAGHQADD
jgi:hypothetical protein